MKGDLIKNLSTHIKQKLKDAYFTKNVIKIGFWLFCGQNEENKIVNFNHF